MFSGNVKVTVKQDKLQQMQSIINELSKKDILVGITQEKDTREGDPVGNAELMFIHTNGSPLKNIPPRPVIEPAIENDREKISQIMGDAVKAALDGKADKAGNLLEEAGLEGQSAAQEWFENPKNGWAELSPSTIEARARRKYKISRYKRQATKNKYRQKLSDYIATGEFKPLIDTDELRKSITYVIREK